MKKGDKVKIRDFSYSQCVVGCKLQDYNGLFGDAKGEFVVVEVDCKFPQTVNQKYWYPDGKEYNDTVLQSIQSGRVVFIEERFLVPAQHTITIDGKEITISHEFYQALKRSL